MKRTFGVAVVTAMVLVAAGVAMAQWAGAGQGYGPRHGMMGWGPGGGEGRGFGPGGGPCWSGQAGTAGTAAAIDEAKAKQIASDYVTKNLPGYQVEKLVKFDRPRGAMYQVEVKGPQGELQYLHINPWGNVRTFGAGRVL